MRFVTSIFFRCLALVDACAAGPAEISYANEAGERGVGADSDHGVDAEKTKKSKCASWAVKEGGHRKLINLIAEVEDWGID